MRQEALQNQNSKTRGIGELIFQYRYPIALVLLFFLTVSGTNGSSVAQWGQYLKNPSLLSNTLFGAPRAIRSDEWATQTALLLSQFKGESPLSYFSSLIGSRMTDMFLVYGQPVLDIAVLFRPFHWGFLLFGVDYGMSFYWWGRLIFLFLSSLELAMLFTDGKKYLAAPFAALVAFSPMIHWWYVTNGSAELFIFGNYAVVLLWRLFRKERIGVRMLYGLALVIPAGGFVLTLYPAWMVPLGWIYLGIFVGLVFRDRKEMEVLCGAFVAGFAVFVLLFGGGMLYIFMKSSDTVGLALHSVYPGARRMYGGESYCGYHFYSYVFNPLMQFKETQAHFNSCEMAGFYSFYPLGLILSVAVMIKRKKADPLLIAGLILDVFLTVYTVTGFPPLSLHDRSVIAEPGFLAKFTLLSFSASTRIVRVMGFLHLFVLFRALSLLPEVSWEEVPKNGLKYAGLAAVSAAFASLLGWHFYRGDYPALWFVIGGGILFFALLLLFFLCVPKVRKWSALLLSILAVLMVFQVNPLQKGLDVFQDDPTVSAVEAVVEKDPDGLWVVDGMDYPINNFTIIAGAPTLNATHVYPDTDTWRKIDPEGNYQEIYNRYAHILVALTDENTSFELLGQDHFRIDLNTDDLQTLGVSYIFTNRPLEEYFEGLRCVDALENGFRIYEVSAE